MTSAERAFYTAQSTTSDPGEFAPRLAALPGDPRRFATIVSGLVLHPVVLERRRVDHPHAHERDAEARPVRELLHRIVDRDARPLDLTRPASDDQLPPERRQFFVDQRAAGKIFPPEVPARVIVWLCSPLCDLDSGAVLDLRRQPEYLMKIDEALKG